MNLTKHFKLSEFNCKDGTVVPKRFLKNAIILAIQLEVIRSYIFCPITINSAYRTKSHNRKVKGVKNSQHLFCKAVDIRCNKLNSQQLGNLIVLLMDLKLIKKGAVIVYPSFVHYDVRGYKYYKY